MSVPDDTPTPAPPSPRGGQSLAFRLGIRLLLALCMALTFSVVLNEPRLAAWIARATARPAGEIAADRALPQDRLSRLGELARQLADRLEPAAEDPAAPPDRGDARPVVRRMPLDRVKVNRGP